MKVKAEISMDIPRSLYCSKQNGELCKYAASWENTGRFMYCVIHQTRLTGINKELYLKCERCLLNLRKAMMTEGRK